MAVDAVMNATLVSPTKTAIGNAASKVGAAGEHEHRRPERERGVDHVAGVEHAHRAAASAPITDPTLNTE